MRDGRLCKDAGVEMTSEQWPLDRVVDTTHETIDAACMRVAHRMKQLRCSRRQAAYVEAATALAAAYDYRGIFP